ncbi:M28 family metallopeptidase [Psychroserpens sp.]|uniref:M28 family metallopeptidase n=1 Tax=Psychroserpens sp. TaxID=2020870 RepID=UPI00385A5F5F
MQKYLLLFLFLIYLNSFSQDLSLEQKEIISVLSGNSKSPIGKTITNRSSIENRQLTREYLSYLIENLNLEAQIQNYKMPNVNPLIDLLFNPFVGANVYTILPSTEKSDNYIILGAHFDTERHCPGAIDNATGMTIIYSVLKELKTLNFRNKNIIVVFFDQEEENLIGSQAFAKYCLKDELNIHSVHTFDTMGWDRDGDKAVEIELPTKDLKELYEKNAKLLNIPIYEINVNSTDHHSFRELGFNAVGLTDELMNGDYAPFKDTKKDTFQTVNFEYVLSCTNLVFETIKDIVTQ